MYRILPDVELSKFYPEGFRVFYDTKNNKYMGLMTRISGKGERLKVKDELMQEWCEGVLRNGGNYTCKPYKKIFFEAILDNSRPRIMKYMTDLYERINCKITEKNVDNFIEGVLTGLS